jgi:hypothetical protein
MAHTSLCAKPSSTERCSNLTDGGGRAEEGRGRDIETSLLLGGVGISGEGVISALHPTMVTVANIVRLNRARRMDELIPDLMVKPCWFSSSRN